MSPHNTFKQALQLQHAGRTAEAIAAYRAVIAAEPAHVSAHINLGEMQFQAGQLSEAEALLSRAVALQPRNHAALVNLAVTHQKLGHLQRAIDGLEAALVEVPDSYFALSNLATLYKDQGRCEEAAAMARRAIERAPPDDFRPWSNYLMAIQYSPAFDAAHLLAEHRRWDAVLSAQKPAPDALAPRDPDSRRRLRVGFLSADLCIHPVGVFIGPAVAMRDRARFECHFYALRVRPDGVTERLKSLADGWTDVAAMDDAALAEKIRADRIDILFDLAGHTAHNRLGVFARRAAPVQASWAGYVGTTGLREMDWLIADRHHVPPGEEFRYRERVLRLPDGYVAFSALGYAPAVGPLPADARGAVTFGCFNNLAKFGPEVATLWANILRALPDARLVMRTRALRDPDTCARVRALFEAQGIAADRLALHPQLPHDQLLAAYGEIDIALDPFPYSGGLTTCEALFMGVPVVTMTGDRFAGRHSTSHLHNVGLGALVAADAAGYRAIAVALAGDRESLRRLRAGLRARLQASPLMHAPRFARHFEAGLESMWREACNGSTSRHAIDVPSVPAAKSSAGNPSA